MYSKAKKRLTDNRLDETFYRKYCEKVPYSYTRAYAQAGMTDSQVIQYVQDGLKQGKSQQQLMMELSAKGVTTEQALRLKQMYENGEFSADSGMQSAVVDTSRMREEAATEKKAEEAKPQESAPTQAPAENSMADQVFGRNIFTNSNLSFEPNTNVAPL